MKVSARNVFAGKVTGIKKGAVNSEVILGMPGGGSVVSVVTNGAVEKLGLKAGMTASAIIKASNIILGKEIRKRNVSARNVLYGTIGNMIEGPVSAEVEIVGELGNTLIAVITEGSLKRLELKVGDEICAIINASSVIIGVDS